VNILVGGVVDGVHRYGFLIAVLNGDVKRNYASDVVTASRLVLVMAA